VVDRIKNWERISIMFLGYGGTGHEGAYLTDTVLLVSYDPKTKTVTQFNIPRDMYIFVNSGPNGAGYWGKINGVFSTIMEWTEPTQDKLDPKYRWKDDKSKLDAAANLTADTVQKIMGVRVDYWVTMNFDGFRKLIDSMGGVDINVERAFVDNQYPRNDNDKIDAGVMTVKFEAGLQHMNGERAIQFARSRKSESEEGGDPARSRRQMKVIAAIKEKALKQNLAFDLLKYLDALQGNIRTTLSFDELRGLASYVNTEDGKALADTSKFDNEIMSGNNVLQAIDQPEYRIIPQAGQGKYSEIQQWVQNAFTYAELRREQVFVQVLNSSGISGIAGKWGDYLFEHGFRVSESQNAPSADKTILYDYTNGAAPANVKQILKYFPNIEVVAKTPDKKPYTGAPDLMLYLGKDYKSIAANP
jgi:LCP family protein required for cell wall assembly